MCVRRRLGRYLYDGKKTIPRGFPIQRRIDRFAFIDPRDTRVYSQLVVALPIRSDGLLPKHFFPDVYHDRYFVTIDVVCEQLRLSSDCSRAVGIYLFPLRIGEPSPRGSTFKTSWQEPTAYDHYTQAGKQSQERPGVDRIGVYSVLGQAKKPPRPHLPEATTVSLIKPYSLVHTEG